MIIKKRPIITWLVDPNETRAANDIVIADVSIPFNRGLLLSYLENLNRIREENVEWGLPELVMPSFEEVMKKSHESFHKIMPSLFEDFSNSQQCGILLCRDNLTLVYGFGGNALHIWCFREVTGKSAFIFYSLNKSITGRIGVAIASTLIDDNNLFHGTLEQRQSQLASIAEFVTTYVAVKKYVRVETVVIPLGKFTAVEGTPLEYSDKKKVINLSGQKVIVMDSRWFRKIINDNDIFVRGFWRLQNKKNSNGEWYKELIFVNPFVRHGYHRSAKIEEDPENKEESEDDDKTK